MTKQEQLKIFRDNLRRYIEQSRKEQKEIAKDLGISYTTFNTWYRGKSLPNAAKVQTLADYFGVKKSDLLDPLDANTNVINFRIPVLGEIHAGIPHDMIPYIVDFEDLSSESFRGSHDEYFGLKINGNSMEPRICNGDTIIVHRQSDAECGDIVIASINDEEGVCKKLMKYPESKSIALVSLNPTYPPLVFTEEEIAERPVMILGVVVELRAKF